MSHRNGAVNRFSGSESLGSEPIVYGASFWYAYSANASFMVAVSVLFRYADFVRYLGGSEIHLGFIVGCGMVGALVMRGIQGVAMDRYGPRVVWLLSLTTFIISLLLHLGIERVDMPAVYMVRIVLMCSIAGTFGASITDISLRAPAGRVPEMIGVLGSSGFIGLALGPMLGDWLFNTEEITRFHITRMFLLSAVMASVSMGFALMATRGQTKRLRRKHPPVLWLLRRYHPGPMLLVGAAMGLGIGLPHTFLRAYAAHLEIPRIQTFFLVYAITAFSVRIRTRRFPEIIGIRAMVLLGLSGLSLSMMLFILVSNEWLFSIPALVGGFAHAFLFPAVVGGGSSSFPNRYRGLGTTLMLAMFDIGNLIGQPIVGGIVEVSQWWGLPPYPTMFSFTAFSLLAVAIYFAWATRKRPTETPEIEAPDRSQKSLSQGEITPASAGVE